VPEQTPDDTGLNETPTRPLVHLWNRTKSQGTRDDLLRTWCGQRVEGPLVCLEPARVTCNRCLVREAADNHRDRWRYDEVLTDLVSCARNSFKI
jgi:hypothetical protein